MKKTTWAVALAGVALGTAAIIWLGAGHVVHAVLAVGWLGFGILLFWQLALFALLGTAWSVVCPGVATWVTVLGRLVREGGENCLPFSEIGGLLFGARAIMLRGVSWSLASASSIADVICEGIGEVPFILFGLVMLLARRPDSPLVLPTALGVGLLVAGAAAGFLLRGQAAKLLHRGAERFAQHWVKDAPERADELQQSLTDLFAQRRRIACASLIHLLAWCGGGGSVWITYHLLGAKIGVIPALAIESLLSGALSIGFLIPGGLGVQEVSYVAIGGLFGMPAHLSLALSLIRRARDIVIGAPALLGWQAIEARQLGKQ